MNADYLQIKQAYLAHYKTKGAKKGIRRFQSYEVAPNPSGYVGQEVGEAAAQSRRVGDDDDNGKKDGSDPKQTVEKLRSSLKERRDAFEKKHPKVRFDQIDDEDVLDLWYQEAKDGDPESKEQMEFLGFDDATYKDWRKMRDNERAVQKQIKELSPKKTTFGDRLRSHYEKKYAKEIEQKHKEIDEKFDREVDKVKKSYYGGDYGREIRKDDLKKLESQRENAHKNAYDRVMEKAADDAARKMGGLAIATGGALIAAAYAPDLKKTISSLRKG